MIPQADKLIAQAKDGERLGSKDRRHCIAYITAIDATTTNSAMADLFGVSEKQIRLDKTKIREDKAAAIREDDIGLVIADISINFDRQIRDVERSKAKCPLGTRVYLDHCRALFQLDLDRVEALQNLGFYPKNLGTMSVEKYAYSAIVSRDGSVETRPDHMRFDDDKVIDVTPGPLRLSPPTAPADAGVDAEKPGASPPRTALPPAP